MGVATACYRCKLFAPLHFRHHSYRHCLVLAAVCAAVGTHFAARFRIKKSNFLYLALGEYSVKAQQVWA